MVHVKKIYIYILKKSLAAQMVKKSVCNAGDSDWFLDREVPLKKGMAAAPSSILA